jgi:hypothetical protein
MLFSKLVMGKCARPVQPLPYIYAIKMDPVGLKSLSKPIFFCNSVTHNGVLTACTVCEHRYVKAEHKYSMLCKNVLQLRHELTHINSSFAKILNFSKTATHHSCVGHAGSSIGLNLQRTFFCFTIIQVRPDHFVS